MRTFLSHLKSNAVAYVALFIALGGTGYAATTLPAGSVGTKQLRNGSVTASKLAKGAVSSTNLNSKTITGHIALWAQVGSSGRVLASSPGASALLTTTPGFERVTWHRNTSSRCLALANVFDVPGALAAGSANVTGPDLHPGRTNYFVSTFNGVGQLAPENVNIVVICP